MRTHRFSFCYIIVICFSVGAIPVQDAQPHLAHTRPALNDFRVKHFFDTRTAISLDTSVAGEAHDQKSLSSHRKDDPVVDDSPSSLEDISEDWDDAFNMDSPYPPFKAKKSVTRKKGRKPRFMKNIDVKASRQATSSPQVSPMTATAEISSPTAVAFLDQRRLRHLPEATKRQSVRSVKEPEPSFRRRPQRRDGVPNFSLPFRSKQEIKVGPSDRNRYSSITNRILNEYIDSDDEA